MNRELFSDIKSQVEEGIRILKNGGVIAFPTDTVYGLGASVFNEAAVRRVFQIKHRSFSKALPILISDIEQLNLVAAALPEPVNCLINKFWPGALTLVVAKINSVPDIVTAGEKTVAVRLPAHPIPVALAKGIGVPVVGTSANLSGWPSPVTAAEVYAQLGNSVDLIIDGGQCSGGIESTIVDITRVPPLSYVKELFRKINLVKSVRYCDTFWRRLMRIAVGSDHRGYPMKQKIMKILSDSGYEYKDFGTFSTESVDYPDIAQKVGEAVSCGGFDRGILICDTGIGMSIAANKVKGIRAALCYDAFCAYRARLHNDANIITLGTACTDDSLKDIIEKFLTTNFEGGRHESRLNKIKAMEN